MLLLQSILGDLVFERVDTGDILHLLSLSEVAQRPDHHLPESRAGLSQRNSVSLRHDMQHESRQEERGKADLARVK